MKRLLIPVAATLAVTASLAGPALAGNGKSLRGTVASTSGTAISIAGRGGITTSCKLERHSPSVANVSVGDRVRAVCAKGHHGRLVLTKLRKDLSVPPAAKDTRPVTFGGAITELTDASISLHDGDRDITCTLGPDSPKTDGFKVGQHAKVACAEGVLVAIAAPEIGRYYVGTVATSTDGALTLATEHGPVTCTITPLSPSTASLKVGDKVGMGCRASTMELVLLRRVDGDTPPTTTPAPTTHTELHAKGAIRELGDRGLALTTDGGNVACSRGDKSPSLDGYAVGDTVAISCVDGVLTAIEKVDGTTGDGTGDTGDTGDTPPGDTGDSNTP
jgi:hypothetical protein